MMIDWDTMLSSKQDSAPLAQIVSHTPQPTITDDSAQSQSVPRPDLDNRRRCIECGNLNDAGACLAAQRGQIIARRRYTPISELLRRCEGYAPMRDDPDQRTPSDRWGQFVADVDAPKSPQMRPTS
jgi:hypothetical protein